MMHKFWMVLFLLIGLCACEPDLGVNLEPEPARLVVNCLFHPGQNWQLNLSQTASAFSDATPTFVNNARVTIYDSTDRFNIVLFRTGNGRYESATSPFPGHVYFLTVTTPNLGKVTARSEIPFTQPMVTSKSTATITPNFLPYFEGEILITDQRFIEEYFLVDLYLGDTEDSEMSFDNLYFTPLSSNDPFIESSDDFAIGGTRNKFEVLLLRDNLIPKEEYVLKFEIEDYLWDDLPATLYALQRVSNVTQDYFLYLESVQDYKASENNPLLELPKIYTNIEGGYGIFAGGNSVAFRIRYN